MPVASQAPALPSIPRLSQKQKQDMNQAQIRVWIQFSSVLVTLPLSIFQSQKYAHQKQQIAPLVPLHFQSLFIIWQAAGYRQDIAHGSQMEQGIKRLHIPLTGASSNVEIFNIS
ncbi:hypothetical protein ACLKA7_011973 [Drosophila subpalustris]